MEYLPIYLKIRNKPVLVFGGGVVAFRKAQTLLKAGADLTICARSLTVDFSLLKRQYGSIRFVEAELSLPFIQQFTLVVAATNDASFNAEVSNIACQANIPVNVVDDPDHCSFIQPAIVNRSPLMIAISSGGAAPVLARRIRQKMEALLPSKLGLVAQAANRLRPRLKRSDIKDKRRFWEKLFDSFYGHFVMEGQSSKAQQIAEDLLNKSQKTEGFVYITGAGPGDADLLTLKALNAIQRADVILYDQLVSGEVLDMARRDATFIPVGKSAGKSSTPQSRINELMVKYAGDGQIVCRLKGGDPLIYGRAGEEMAYLKANHIAYEIIPGITAAMGCAASAGIPVTHRNLADSVTFVTARLKEDKQSDLMPLAREKHTLAIYMGVNSVTTIQSQLRQAGYPDSMPVAIVEKGTTSQQKIITGVLKQLADLAADHQVSTPAMIYVGQTAAFADSQSNINHNEVLEVLNASYTSNNVHHLTA